ncbi:SdpI family protein [Pseudoduganella umbonata]|uniref:DUF1648 domain-containing protein n=1 Tax=Pseudoduganella umbonata TaxID=864828 RepID=A0A4P8HN31_9BURK|nr:SdpI family protein [Pseudoduganella umbonata]MBB3224833.1 putative membrane protein [Pseudoduganella umbonata]QCP11137.1 DUF1648 domain-containing protein [Pseudoduganella umbonata]
MTRQHLIANIVLILAATVLTAFCWPQLPESIAIHWNLAGEPDGWAGRWTLWLTGPGLMALLLAIGAALPYLSPRDFSVASFGATAGHIVTLIVLMAGAVHVLLLAGNFNMDIDIARVVPAGVFLLLILIGNPLGKVRRNFYIGIRTPWTLASERVWYATHRMGARVMVATGMCGLAAVLLRAPAPMLLALIAAAALLPVLYSLMLYKRLERKGQV